MQNIFIFSFHLYFRSYLLIWISSCRTHGQIFRNNQRPHLPSSTQPSLEPLFDCNLGHCGCHGPWTWCWSFQRFGFHELFILFFQLHILFNVFFSISKVGQKDWNCKNNMLIFVKREWKS